MGKAISREDTKNSCVVCKEEKKQGIWCNRCTSTLVCQGLYIEHVRAWYLR